MTETHVSTDRLTSYYLPGEHPHPETELERLSAQATVSWDKEVRLLRGLGLGPGADVLELGSGPGFISRLLLEDLPTGSLTCLELEEHLIDHARALLGEDPRVALVHGSALASGLPDESFDLAHARLVLQHVPGTAAALAEVFRVLRPGGRIAIVDVDDALWGMVDPDPQLPALDEVLRLRQELQTSRGGNRFIGRDLPRLLRGAGFTDIRVDAIAISSQEYGMARLASQLDFRSRTAVMVKVNPVAAAACEELADAVDDWMTRSDSSVLILLFAFSATKPAGENQ